MKDKYILTTFALLVFSVLTFGQNFQFYTIPQVKLPNDSLTRTKLLNSINTFLIDKNDNLGKSTVVDNLHYNQFLDFFDIFKNIEKSKKFNDNNFFKCYLKNIVLQPDNSYKVDLAYYGITKTNEVINRLDISLLAIENKENFKFFCLFKRNTQTWKSTKIGNITFFYQNDFNKQIAKDFDNYNTTLSKKLNLKPLQFKYYKCKDIQEVYSLLGVGYDLTINSEVRSGSFDLTNNVFYAGTNSDQYKHDLTHAYFGLKFADSLRNWTAEEGFNIYSSDFWGKTTEQNFQYLSEFIIANPNTTLLSAFEQDLYLKFPIPIKYPLSALLMRKVERELGFDKVLELISCGKNDDIYFEKLGKMIGLTKQNFDSIIKAELKR